MTFQPLNGSDEKLSWLTYMQPKWVRLSEVRASAPRFDFVRLPTNTRQERLSPNGG